VAGQGKAKNVRLFEHPDFDQVILQAAEHFKLRPAIIEKDYYVTEVLRIIAAAAGDKVIFKGGTSLSKGWNLIQRFSEDIDIFLDPLAFEPPLTKRGIDRELKSLRDAVAAHPALQFVNEESQAIGGFGRNDRFSYHQLYGGPGEVANRVFLEAGAASGREPQCSKLGQAARFCPRGITAVDYRLNNSQTASRSCRRPTGNNPIWDTSDSAPLSKHPLGSRIRPHDAHRCGQPGQQHGRRIPSLSSEHTLSTCCRLVSSFLTEMVQQIHSLRASGVMSSHASLAFASDASAFRRSPGRLCTTPPEIGTVAIGLSR
jgi:hypothetical protein